MSFEVEDIFVELFVLLFCNLIIEYLVDLVLIPPH
jgi:hypothetical protein